MFSQLLPARIGNSYRGHKLALWLFAAVVAVRITQSLAVMFGGASILESADGIPLETFNTSGAKTVVAVWTLLALSRLFLLLLCVLTVLRYRSAIAFMFVLLLLNYLADQLSLQLVPLVRTGTPPGPVVNMILAGLMIVGLALSLRTRGGGSAENSLGRSHDT